VLLEQQELPVRLGHKEQPDLKDLKVPWDRRDQQVFKETPEQQG
jgi:hypothetical protein